MKKIFIIVFTLFPFITFFSSCHKKEKTPEPTNSSSPSKTITGFVNNSFVLGGTTYSTNVGFEQPFILNSDTLYLLGIENSSSSTNTCEFWFESKPTEGDYTVVSPSALVTGIPSGSVIIAVFPGSAGEYDSQDSATPSTIHVSKSGTKYVITVTSPITLQESTTSDLQDLTTTATIP